MVEPRLATLRTTRIQKLRNLVRLGIDPYPSKILIKGRYIKISEARRSLEKEVLTAGRIWSVRKHGAVTFVDLKDDTGKIQLLFQKKSLPDKFNILGLFDTGDFIAVKGKVVKTQAGEITVDV
jgi:lysyl-tRNA synthetase class 2